MPVIDLGSVVGPQGPQGETGPQGARGVQGLPGPNQLTNETSTPLSGILKGNGSVVSAVQLDTAPVDASTNPITSGAVADVVANEILTVTLPSFSAMGSFTASGITANHVLVASVLGTPSAQTGDWTVVTTTDTITLSGSISGSTTATLYFALQGTAITATAN